MYLDPKDNKIIIEKYRLSALGKDQIIGPYANIFSGRFINKLNLNMKDHEVNTDINPN